MFSKNKILNRAFFNGIEAADVAAQNCTYDKIVFSKQVFVAFGKEKKNIAEWQR